jgi:hypothetical protein
MEEQPDEHGGPDDEAETAQAYDGVQALRYPKPPHPRLRARSRPDSGELA